MSWQDHCAKCNDCGMDMDLEPFCVNEKVIELRIAEPGAHKSYPYGLDVNIALRLCKGNFETPRKERR